MSHSFYFSLRDYGPVIIGNLSSSELINASNKGFEALLIGPIDSLDWQFAAMDI